MKRLASLVLLLVAAPFAHAQAKPKPDARFGNWLYKTPDPAVWTRTEKAGSLIFSTSLPPGDFCTLTLIAGGIATADFKQQFADVIDADQKAKGMVKITADSGPTPGKAAEGYDTLTRSSSAETQTLHTSSMYLAGHSGDRFDLASFQTTSDETWTKYGPQAAQFLLSLKLANSLPPDQVAALVGTRAALPPTLPGFGDPTPAAPEAAAAPQAPAAPQPPAAVAAIKIPDVPPENSPLVTNNAVIQKDGKPVDPIKLSIHDSSIGSPSITTTPTGAIHVAFVEQHKTTYALAVYHRSSTDNGVTWTESKNLSEPMPGIQVGHCQVVSNPAGRVYVIWRTGLAVNFPATLDPYGGSPSNLVYRVLENGKWSKILPISIPANSDTQDQGALSFFAATDAAGHVQIVWNCNPDKWHPELTVISGEYHQHISGIGNGLVFQSTLDGTTPSAPREVYLSPLTDKDPNNKYTGALDGLDTLNGYFDSTGAMHMVARVNSYAHPISGKYRYQVLENGKPGPFVDLPELSYHAWRDIPTLLVDAKGQRHIVTMYPYGEHPDVRDYVLGSDEDPTIIRATIGSKATLDGFQAFQGPGGKMVALMQMNDSGERGEGDDFLSISTGEGKWSTPINITNNHGRASFASKQHGASGVAVSTNYYPGPGAVTFAPDGHLLLVMINNEHSLFGSSAFGVQIAGGSSSTPTLRFLRF